jgi:hypothetical protein
MKYRFKYLLILLFSQVWLAKKTIPKKIVLLLK